MLMLENLPQMAETAAKAIANVKFDKVVVWDGGQGKGATANFLQGMAHTLPPMLQMMKDIGGVEMPRFLGSLKDSGMENGEVEAPPERRAERQESEERTAAG